MVRIVRFHEFGGPPVLKVDDVDISEPGANEVRISIEAIGLKIAFLTDPSGVYIELTEGLDEY